MEGTQFESAMKDIFISDRLRDYLPRYEKIVTEHIIPLEGKFLSQPFGKVADELEKVRLLVKKEGLWAPHMEKEYGGVGFSLLEFAHISELLGKSPYGHYCFNCQAPDIGNMELLLGHASEQIKKRFLRPLVNGDIRSCFGMTEPEFAGSNPVNMAATAVNNGDHYIINGHKWFASSADGAAFTVVMAETNPESANPYQKASMIIVPNETPGYQLVRNIPVMGEAGEGYFSHGELQFVNCEVPAENLVGQEGAGFTLAQERLGPGRIHHCMRWLGICERAFDMMCSRAATRELARGKMLGEQQTVQNWIAESRAEIDASRYMVLHTALKIDAEGAKAAKIEISTIKFYVANVLTQVLDRALQVHGALGMTDDTIIAYWYRHERAARIYDGPDEVHKSSLARKILKQYGLKTKMV
jgi:alkylation response protein AidB-like acyl-CoA dehydrogenase